MAIQKTIRTPTKRPTAQMHPPQNKNNNKQHNYIYIYIERERERKNKQI